MLRLLVEGEDERLGRERPIVTVHDPCCGTGGMLAIAKDVIQGSPKLEGTNPNAVGCAGSIEDAGRAIGRSRDGGIDGIVDALDSVDRIDKRIVLVDGEQLAAFMYEYGIGITPAATYAVKRIDSDFFAEEV